VSAVGPARRGRGLPACLTARRGLASMVDPSLRRDVGRGAARLPSCSCLERSGGVELNWWPVTTRLKVINLDGL
jgi:hypothetical protein